MSNTAALTAPSDLAVGYGGGSAALTPDVGIDIPFLTAEGLGHDATYDNSLAYTAPSALASGYGGANGGAAAPSATVAMTATIGTRGSGDLTLGSPTLSATGTVSATAQGDLTFGSVNYGTYGLVGYSGAVCSVTLTDSPTVLATGTIGGVADAALSLPLFELVAIGTVNKLSYANLLAPAAQLGATAQAWLVAPSATLVAIGSATVVATYEAYAVNLKHTPAPGQEPVDEATRYTSYPFTHIVRYKNSYYGANSTGLYLLEGTTDAATPIPWAFKTAVSDFKSPFHKTVASAYFSGRLGAADTITLYAGEGAQTQAYSYTTPRGALAQNYRQAFGKGIKSHRYYALGAAGSGELMVDTITLDTHDMKRRI